MPNPLIARPKELSDNKREDLRKYLSLNWKRALDGREAQVDSDYARWSKVYAGTPLEKERTVPFYKASNLVVPLVRIYVDTFVARTLNIMFATKPLYVVDGMPTDMREAWEAYLNRKAIYNWDHYNLAKSLLFRGTKNGSVVFKTTYEDIQANSMIVGPDGNPIDESYSVFTGPLTTPIPFEDFYVYPTIAEAGASSAMPWQGVLIKFHRCRYPEETAREMYAKGDWELKVGKDAFDSYLSTPRDIKQTNVESDAKVDNPYYKEFQVIECHLRWAISNDETKMYDIVALLQPQTQELIDVYFNPYSRGVNTFVDYRPYPREGLWYGESLCQILGTVQEEVSTIHNDRRNNSFIANAVCFKRRNGSLLPNPSTNWYPGKVWDLESMDDLDVINIGRDYSEMLQQEDYAFGLADKLSAIGQTMQGAEQGQQGSRGVYNTMGTLSVMSEGNQRQDTNIRDARSALGALIDTCSRMQARWGSDDPVIGLMEEKQQASVRQAFELLKAREASHIRHEVRASNAGANSEARKASLLQMSQVIGQYGQTVQQMSQQLLNPGINPGLRMLLNDVVNMQAWMATRLLREFGEADAVEVLPDVKAAIESIIPGGSRGTQESTQSGGSSAGNSGGAGDVLPPVSGSQLAAAAALPGQVGAGGGR